MHWVTLKYIQMLRSDGVRRKCEAVHAFFIHGLPRKPLGGGETLALAFALKVSTTCIYHTNMSIVVPADVLIHRCSYMCSAKWLHKPICLTWTTHSGKWNGIATEFGTNNWRTIVHPRTNIRITEFFLPQKHCRNQTIRELIKTNPCRVILSRCSIYGMCLWWVSYGVVFRRVSTIIMSGRCWFNEKFVRVLWEVKTIDIISRLYFDKGMTMVLW